jgi:hypothetical protein
MIVRIDFLIEVLLLVCYTLKKSHLEERKNEIVGLTLGFIIKGKKKASKKQVP